MDPSGYIKLFRKFLEWEWYDDINCKVLFIHLLIKANYKEKQWRGKTIQRGQLFTSIDNLAEELHLTTKQIRIAISKLENTGEITKKGASEGTYITICNYDNYQHLEQAEGQTKGERGASDGQAEGERGATTKKEKKEINISFDVFWDLYGKKKDRVKCEGKWKRLTNKEREACIAAIPVYIKSTPDIQYRKDPATYLNNKSWENEIIVPVESEYQMP